MTSTSQPPSIINIHTPTASWSLIHSPNEESLTTLFDKLSRKAGVDYRGARAGPGWVKYEWNEGVWDLSDDSDYTIWAWRLTSGQPSTSASTTTTPTLYLHAPESPLPDTSSYRNPLYYLFRNTPDRDRASVRSGKAKSKRSAKSRHNSPPSVAGDESSSVPAHVREFKKFHSENGVRTVIGTIGPVPNVRMLLKSSHRHVYISRKFAVRRGFVPRDASPGQYGYGGLVNIGKWPISLGRTPSSTPNVLPKTVTMNVYLSEEPHFDVILGRSFHEARRIRTDPLDPTDVRCMDTGEKVDCEVVVLRDGHGDVVTVT